MLLREYVVIDSVHLLHNKYIFRAQIDSTTPFPKMFVVPVFKGIR